MVVLQKSSQSGRDRTKMRRYEKYESFISLSLEKDDVIMDCVGTHDVVLRIANAI